VRRYLSWVRLPPSATCASCCSRAARRRPSAAVAPDTTRRPSRSPTTDASAAGQRPGELALAGGTGRRVRSGAEDRVGVRCASSNNFHGREMRRYTTRCRHRGLMGLIGNRATERTSEIVLPVGDATLLGPVHVRGKVADVHDVRYSCTFGDHIWVSVKQKRQWRKSIPRPLRRRVRDSAAAPRSLVAEPSQLVHLRRQAARRLVLVDAGAGKPRPASRRAGGCQVQFTITEGGAERLDAIRMEWSRVVVKATSGRPRHAIDERAGRRALAPFGWPGRERLTKSR